MLHKRILINNKSASKHSNGLLKGYRYSFSGDSNLWKGATANILPDLNVFRKINYICFQIVSLLLVAMN